MVAPALLVGLVSTALADASPPGSICFVARMVTLGESDGCFARWRITEAVVDEGSPSRSLATVEIDLGSVDTGIEERDRHLRGERFFDVARFPVARATVREPHFEDPDHFTADVTLDLHGVTQTVPMSFRVVDRAGRRIEGRVTLRRLDFGMGPKLGWWNPMNVKNDVDVRVEVVVPRPGENGFARAPGAALTPSRRGSRGPERARRARGAVSAP
jgi:polyisoprenoid-binding protein YceI